MDNLLLNEKKYIENIWNLNTYPTDIYPYTLVSYFTRLLYFQNNDLSIIKNMIINKMNTYNLNVTVYEEYIADNIIDKYYNLLSKGSVDKLRDIDFIPLYKSELDIINSAKTQRQRKFLFTLYIIARYTNRFGWVYLQDTELYKLANISKESRKKSNIIYELKQDGLIKLTVRVDDNKIGVNLSDGKDDKIVFKVESLKYLGNQYVAFVDNTKRCCCQCGKLIKIKSKYDSSTKYCKKCAIETEAKNATIRKRKQRNG